MAEIDEGKAAKASGEAAAAVVETVAAVEANAEAAIEAAQEATEAAEDLAEDLAAAAMETARMARVENIEQELETWRSAHLQSLTKLETELKELEARMMEAMAQTITVKTTAAEPLAPAILPAEPIPEILTEVIVEPGTVKAPASDENTNPAPQKPARRPWI